MITLSVALQEALAGNSLHQAQAEHVMGRVLGGEVEPEWLAGWLIALRMKGETADEVAGFARAMRKCATPVRPTATALVDTCGTGGDDSGSFNISTTAAFVVAAAGGHVAKHGNRSVSSKCGSADVLEALGASLDLDPNAVATCIDEVGFGFLFAPKHHSAMRHAVGPRKALGVRTVFNMLGPLTNPAGAAHQVIGVYDRALVNRLGPVLQHLGQGRSLLVHGDDGLDELTVTTTSTMLRVEDGLHKERIDPKELGLSLHAPESLRGGDAQDNAAILRRVFDGEGGAPRDVVILNAAAALYAAGKARGLTDGLQAAARAIDAGKAREVLEGYVEFTQRHRDES